MQLVELVSRLDAFFRPAAIDEHDGWDFCFGPGEWDALLARTPPDFAATCNGLMIAPAKVYSIRRVGSTSGIVGASTVISRPGPRSS